MEHTLQYDNTYMSQVMFSDIQHILFCCRTRYYKPVIEGVEALDRSQELQSLTIIQNTESVQPYG